MHAIVARGAPDVKVPGSLGAFFRDNAYIVGGHRLSMDEVEHGILRCNQVCGSGGSCNACMRALGSAPQRPLGIGPPEWGRQSWAALHIEGTWEASV